MQKFVSDSGIGENGGFAEIGVKPCILGGLRLGLAVLFATRCALIRNYIIEKKRNRVIQLDRIRTIG